MTHLTKIHSNKAELALVELLAHPDTEIVFRAVRALEEYGKDEKTLQRLVESPNLDIMSPQLFSLARKLTIRFSHLRLSFIPIYPENIQHKIPS